MPISHVETQVTWNGSNDVVLGSGAFTNSDVFTPDDTTVLGTVIFKANNSGTPTNGDIVEFYLLGSLGDPDGSSGDEYTSRHHGFLLAALDTFVENPALSAPVQLPIPLAGAKIYATNGAASNVTISATTLEQRIS